MIWLVFLGVPQVDGPNEQMSQRMELPSIQDFRGKLAVSSTWRIIPVSKWLITMVIVSPLNGVIPFQMAFLWLISTG